jgi:hypothetical protein
MQQQHLYILRSRAKANILGTGSVAFGFRSKPDAVYINKKMADMGPMVEVWYTKISPEKFVLTTSPRAMRRPSVRPIPFSPMAEEDKEREKEKERVVFEIEYVERDVFLEEMLDKNLSVRIIDEIYHDFQMITLYSHMGYEPRYSTDEAARYLEDMFRV